MEANLIELAKACPEAIISVKVGDLIEANEALVARTKEQLEQIITDQSVETYPSREKVAELLEIVDDTDLEADAVIIGSEDLRDPVVIKYKPVVVEPENEPVENEIFVLVEKMPAFPGGDGALFQYLNKNIKYPVVPQEQGIQGKVIIQFVVDRDGTITDPVVVRSVDPYLDKEALRVIKAMPKWTPGMQRNQAVRVKYTVPVTFRLQ